MNKEQIINDIENLLEELYKNQGVTLKHINNFENAFEEIKEVLK